ncbi:cuticle protein 18.6 [Daphnia magna]|uniref:cuticle protein 18.6 n=1 Tax=Daphnia magna TaxID=35525 RepID=UPI001E1BA709|nr:cuticle protein 18.6 [Daphnia magna]
MNKFVVLATLFASAMATADPSYSIAAYPAPAYPAPAPAYPAPAYPATMPAYEQPAYSKPAEEDYSPMPFDFAYEVKDDATYQDFSHKEASNGKVVTGSYRVALPDSRTQIVTYKADENGYVADVKYEGEAKYDEYKPAAYPAESAYPRPAYPAESAYPMPTYSEPSNPKPAYSEPSYPKPAY